MADDMKKTDPDETPERELRPRRAPERGRDRTDAGAGAGPDTATILGREDILRALSALPSLVALNVLKPPQVTAMKGVYQTLLTEAHRERTSSGEGVLADETVLEMLRKNPQLLNLMEPVLTETQIRAVLQQGDGRASG